MAEPCLRDGCASRGEEVGRSEYQCAQDETEDTLFKGDNTSLNANAREGETRRQEYEKGKEKGKNC